MEKQKEIYKLWFEYLKRSDDYTVFCDWTKENSDCLRHGDGMNLVASSIYEGSPFWETQRLLGYVHDFESFEDWWTDNRGHFERQKKEHEARENMFPPCKVWSEKALFEYLRSAHTVEETREYPNNRLFIDIDLCHDVGKIKKAVGDALSSDIVKKRMKACRQVYNANENPELSFMRIIEGYPLLESLPGHRKPDVEMLKLYLRVYDLWFEKLNGRNPRNPSKSKWQEIMDIVEPGRNVRNEEDRRLFQSYKERAEKIIENAAQGVFPGKY